MSRSDTRPLSALTIAGSDSGGAAGIQADLKTFAVHVPPVAFLRAQIDACFDDFRIGAVKLGMLDRRITAARALRVLRRPGRALPA